MIKEDLKVVRAEIIKKEILNEYGKNSIKIEELNKQINLYNYNKKAINFSLLTGAGFMLGSFLLMPTLLPTFILTPLISLISVGITITTEKIINKINKSKEKYKLFQRPSTREKLEKEKLNKLIEKEKLVSRNKVLDKSLKILKGNDSISIKNNFNKEKGTKDLNKISKYNTIKLEKETNTLSRIMSPENIIFGLTLSIGSMLGGFYTIINSTTIINDVLSVMSILISSSSISLSGITNSEMKNEKKVNRLIKEEQKMKEQCKDLNMDDLIYDLAIEEIKLNKEKVIAKENKEKKNIKNNKVHNYYKRKAAIINRSKKPKKLIKKISHI